MEAKSGELPMGSPAHVLFTTDTGDWGNADAWRMGSTDTLGAALRHLFAIGTLKSGPAFGIAKLAERAFGLFSTLYVLEFYCDKTVRQGWRIEEGEAWRILPPGLDPFGRSSITVDWRRDQEHGEWNIVAGMAWREGRGFDEITVSGDDHSGALKTVLASIGTSHSKQPKNLAAVAIRSFGRSRTPKAHFVTVPL